MRRYIFVASGFDDFTELYEHASTDTLVAVDGGLTPITKKGLKAKYFFGDLDSLKQEDLHGIKDVNIYSSIKDESDLELALNKIMTSTNYEILIYNATGGRLDHFYANIRLLIKYRNERIKIIDKQNIIYLITKETVFTKDKYKYISFFNIDKETIITLKGFKYDITNYRMKDNDNLCLSNEILDEGIVTSNKPLLVIKSLD